MTERGVAMKERKHEEETEILKQVREWLAEYYQIGKAPGGHDIYHVLRMSAWAKKIHDGNYPLL